MGWACVCLRTVQCPVGCACLMSGPGQGRDLYQAAWPMIIEAAQDSRGGKSAACHKVPPTGGWREILWSKLGLGAVSMFLAHLHRHSCAGGPMLSSRLVKLWSFRVTCFIYIQCYVCMALDPPQPTALYSDRLQPPNKGYSVLQTRFYPTEAPDMI